MSMAFGAALYSDSANMLHFGFGIGVSSDPGTAHLKVSPTMWWQLLLIKLFLIVVTFASFAENFLTSSFDTGQFLLVLVVVVHQVNNIDGRLARHCAQLVGVNHTNGKEGWIGHLTAKLLSPREIDGHLVRTRTESTILKAEVV